MLKILSEIAKIPWRRRVSALEHGFYPAVDVIRGEAELFVEDFIWCGGTEAGETVDLAMEAVEHA